MKERPDKTKPLKIETNVYVYHQALNPILPAPTHASSPSTVLYSDFGHKTSMHSAPLQLASTTTEERNDSALLEAPGCRNDALHSDAIPLVDLSSRSTRTELVDRNDLALGAHVLLPSERAPCFDTDPCGDRFRENTLLVFIRLLLKKFPADKRHDTGSFPLLRQLISGFGSDLQLGTGTQKK